MTLPEKARPEALENVPNWPPHRGASQLKAESRSDLVPTRLPTGEQAWVTPEAFNLIGEQTFRDSRQLHRLRSQRNLAAGLAVGALIILAAGTLALATRPAARSVAQPAPSTSAAASASETQSEESPVISTSVISTGAEGAIASSIQAWAEAWSSRDAESVLGFYSQNFPVPDGLRRPLWEQLRRERVESPELLAVTVSDLAIESTGPQSATANFVQRYDTPGYRLWVKKTLQLVMESGDWRIVDESASLAELGPLSASPPENSPSASVTTP